MVHTGVTVGELPRAGRAIFDNRVRVLRRSTLYWWSSLACIVMIPAMLGYARSAGKITAEGVYLGYAGCLLLAVVGLFAKAPAEPIAPENKQDRMLIASMPLVHFIHVCERYQFRRSCWLLLVVCFVSSALLQPSPQPAH